MQGGYVTEEVWEEDKEVYGRCVVCPNWNAPTSFSDRPWIYKLACRKRHRNDRSKKMDVGDRERCNQWSASTMRNSGNAWPTCCFVLDVWELWRKLL